MGVNKKLLPVKLHFFFCLAGAAPVAPFIPLMMKELGFSATVAGSILTVIPVVAMFAKPWVGALADRYRMHKSILVILLAVNIALMMSFRLVPSLPVDNSVKLNCSIEVPEVVISTSKADDQCFIDALSSSTTSGSAVICKFSLNGRTNESYDNTITDASGPSLSHEEIYLNFSLPYAKDSNTIGVRVSDINSTSSSSLSVSCNTSEYLIGGLHCENPLLYEIVTKSKVEDSNVLKYHQFWLLLLVVLAMRVIGSCTENLSDSICFKMLDGKSYNYGIQRMWGSAGWGITSVISGMLVDKFSEGKARRDRSIAFYLSAVIALIDVIVCLKFKVTDVKAKKSTQIWSKVRTIMVDNPRFIIFLGLVVACGMFSAFIWNFLFWLIEDIVKEDGCTDTTRVQTLNGLALAVNCYLGEIPFFFLSGWFLRKLGYEHCMTLVLAAFGVRFIAYYFLVNPWYILPLETLNGITFGLFYSTMTTYANALTPPGLQGTMQGFVSATFEGVGLSLGSFIGGYLFDQVGGRHLFLLGGGFALFLAAFHAALLLCLAKPREDVTIFESSVSDIASQGGFTIPPEQVSCKSDDWK